MEEMAEELRAALARGAASAGAQAGADDAGGRTSEGDAQPNAEGEAGRSGAEEASRPNAGERGGADGAALEQPVGPVEGESLVSGPEGARNEGATTVEEETPATGPVDELVL